MLSLSLGFSEDFYDNIQTQGRRDGDHHAQHTFDEDRLLVKKICPSIIPTEAATPAIIPFRRLDSDFLSVTGFDLRQKACWCDLS
jgi:hypothetical protein